MSLSNFIKPKEKKENENLDSAGLISSRNRVFGSKNNMNLNKKKEVEIDFDRIKSIEDLPFNDLRIVIDWPGKGNKEDPEPRPLSLFTPEGLQKNNYRNQYLPEKYEHEIKSIEDIILKIKEAKTENRYSRPGRKSYMDGIVNFKRLRLRYAMNLTSQAEMWVILRSIPDIIPSIDQLGINARAVETLKNLAQSKDGLILVCGSTGAGKTTTMAALIKHITEEQGAFTYTIEDPCEYLLQGPHGSNGYCIQTEVEDHGGWINGVVNALRSKPDCLVLGEIRESEVAKMSIRAAQTGHLVLSTLHAGSVSDAVDSIVRLADGSDSASIRDQVAQRLRAIIYQTREGEHTNMYILDFTKEDNKKQLGHIIKENKTSALDESWAEKFITTQSHQEE